MLTFKKAQLPNGLEVIAEVNDAAHSAAVGFMVKTGAATNRPTSPASPISSNT